MYGSANRKHNIELVDIHANGNNTVLLSPSMQEGVDLYDELARFQIILKMPWTSLEDFRTSVKSEFEPDWYSNLMWNDIMQSSGRATRHADDYSTTYILDASFVWFYDKWKHRLPVWFKKRIIF
jgi:Rad3-related DNA helicase